MSEEPYMDLLWRLPLKDKILLLVAPYLPMPIQRRIKMRYLKVLISMALKFGLEKAQEEMGDEAFQLMLDQIPTEIQDEDGTWILPPGTSREEVFSFLTQLRDREEAEKGGNVK